MELYESKSTVLALKDTLHHETHARAGLVGVARGVSHPAGFITACASFLLFSPDRLGPFPLS
jgi:hypothetical protein